MAASKPRPASAAISARLPTPPEAMMVAVGTAPSDLLEQLHVRSAEAAIAGDGRHREPAQAGLRESLRQPQHVRTASAGHPAIPDGTPITDIQGGNDTIRAMPLDEHAAERGSADEGAAEDDTVGSGGQGFCCLVRAADAPSHLAADASPVDDGRHRRRLQGLALASRVQIDDMDPRRTLVRPAAGNGDRVVAVIGDRVEVASREAYDPPSQQVDGRYQFHATMLPCYLTISAAARPRRRSSRETMSLDPAEWRSDASSDLLDTILALPDRAGTQSASFVTCARSASCMTSPSGGMSCACSMPASPTRRSSRTTGASTATVTRIAGWLHHGTGGYRQALARQPGPGDPR